MGWSMTDGQTETWNCFHFVVPGFDPVSLEWMTLRTEEVGYGNKKVDFTDHLATSS
jgi:hypothetical protein